MYGWCPLLICNSDTITDRFGTKEDKSWLGTIKWTVVPGGWTLGAFSLEMLYEEHESYRNNWTASNSGLDLVRYLGTTVTLMAHPNVAYIFWWDPDYHTLQEQVQYVHPAILMNKINHRVVLPMMLTKKACVKIRIPPPSTYERDWRFSKDTQDMGMFAFAACLYDYKNPFVKAGVDMPTTSEGQKEYWWVKWTDGVKTPLWLQNWGSATGKTQIAVAGGPFVQKYLDLSNSPCQIWMKYKCHWQFGGEVLPPESVADPANPDKPPGTHRYIGTARINPIWNTPDAEHPKHPSKHHIKRLDSGGECSPNTWKRLTEQTDSDYTTVSSSDGSISDGLSLCRTMEKNKPTQKKKSKESLQTQQARQHRVHGLSFDLFLRHLEQQLGRPLSTKEKLLATKSFRKHKGKSHTQTETAAPKTGAATGTSPGGSTWSLCC